MDSSGVGFDSAGVVSVEVRGFEDFGVVSGVVSVSGTSVRQDSVSVVTTVLGSGGGTELVNVETVIPPSHS